VSRLTVLHRLPRFVQGTHTNLREVAMHRTAELALEFLDPVTFQLDGDVQQFADARRFRISVVPRSLRVRV
jgi:diacylglycerol kinase family enzyme